MDIMLHIMTDGCGIVGVCVGHSFSLVMKNAVRGRCHDILCLLHPDASLHRLAEVGMAALIFSLSSQTEWDSRMAVMVSFLLWRGHTDAPNQCSTSFYPLLYKTEGIVP
jgi:hypothetical protein